MAITAAGCQIKHARKMQEIMTRCNIPPNTPFDPLTLLPRPTHPPRTTIRASFVAKDEVRMQEIMARYNVPRDVPYEEIASGGGAY